MLELFFNFPMQTQVKVKKDKTRQRGILQVAVEISHFQVKNNCSHDSKYDTEHTRQLIG